MKIDPCKKFELDHHSADADDESRCDICKRNSRKSHEFCLVIGDFKHDVFSAVIFRLVFAYVKLAFSVSAFLVVWLLLSDILDWIFS